MRLSLILTAAAALALAGCGERAAAPEVDEAAAAGDDAATAFAPPTTAAGFVDAAASSANFEILSARVAATMARDPAVKAHARAMASAHARSLAELTAAAARASPPVPVMALLTPAQQAALDQLNAAGAGFDAVYAAQQVAAHEQALALLEGYVEGGDSAPLKAFAETAAPIAKAHLEQARALLE